MLCVNPTLTRKGYGKMLVTAAQDRAREAGCKFMQLELLVPVGWEHPYKVMLDSWYQRLGYDKGQPLSFTEHEPSLAPLLSGECTFTAYTKTL